ncbi:hypothetical protein CHX27_07635 [Flavobacterium aurantiibacter]|uniref:Uncharacterized protein n=1 Tax=Flavobacterium aurantiibacter TaxID=2023067 RepID=A0A255ZTU7_9FLAO|nr:hypothetical protein CHX27_07635 [Flavobacterium aurantiibacter]
MEIPCAKKDITAVAHPEKRKGKTTAQTLRSSWRTSRLRLLKAQEPICNKLNELIKIHFAEKNYSPKKTPVKLPHRNIHAKSKTNYFQAK